MVARQQAVPSGSPDDLDDVPACAPEGGFQFGDDFSIAAYRAIEALEIAVHHKDQVIELFASAQADGAHGFWLVAFSITHKSPDFTGRFGDKATVFQVTHEPGLINR